MGAMQRGQVFKSHGAWFLRYYRDELNKGKPVRRRITKRLASVDKWHRSEGDLDSKVQEILGPLNQGSAAEGTLTIAEFADTYFLPTIKAKRTASTHKFYSDLFENHLRTSIGSIALCDFRTVDAQRTLDSITLSLSSLRGIKTGMSAMFGLALRLGYLNGVNPVYAAKPEGKKTNFEGAAYTAADVEFILSKVTGVARVVVAVAAFTGLRLAELRGLQWSDYDGQFLYVRRSVWRKNVGGTKTPDSKAKVPVIAPLRKVLDAHRKNSGGNTWIFQGAKNKFSLHLDNLCRREIRPKLGDRWHGWHAFRRGIATVLFGLGVDAEVAAMILRHSDSATTRRHYIKLQAGREGTAAMQRLEKALAGQQMGSNKKRSK